MKYLTLILALLLISCGPSFYLKRAKINLKKAEQLGADVSMDTVYKNVPLITPERRIDTVHHYVNLTDTITVIKDRVVTKIKVNTEEKTVYINTKCPSDTIYKEVPITITKNIEAKSGLPWWVYLVFGLSALVIVALIVKR